MPIIRTADKDTRIKFIKHLREGAPFTLGLKEAKGICDMSRCGNYESDLAFYGELALNAVVGMFTRADIEIQWAEVGVNGAICSRALMLKNDWCLWVNGSMCIGKLSDFFTDAFDNSLTQEELEEEELAEGTPNPTVW
jgi:hypothetical protein